MKEQKLLAGLYLDTQKAVVIRPAPDYEEGDYIIQETMEAEKHDREGDADSKNHARQSDLLKYFKAVAAMLLVYDEVYVFGPGNTQEQFQNHLKEDAQFNNKKVSIDSSEQLSENKMILKVREFFKTGKLQTKAEMKSHL
jgi:stalled ribosome rescue protein Dom34